MIYFGYRGLPNWCVLKPPFLFEQASPLELGDRLAEPPIFQRETVFVNAPYAIQTGYRERKAALPKWPQCPVMAVTECAFYIGETPVVNMVRRVRKKVLFEPGDTRQQWKGEAAASFVCEGITSSRVLPTSSAGYWSPS
jgi:hypothetical protein